MRNPVEEPTHSQDKVSTANPDSTYATKGGTPARMGYYKNYLVDNHSCIVVGVQATGARLSEESRAAEDMIARFAEWQGGPRHHWHPPLHSCKSGPDPLKTPQTAPTLSTPA